MNIAGKVALVTGGASGLGLATVKELHDAGASIVIADLSSSDGETMAKELGDRVAFAADPVPGDEGVGGAIEIDAVAALPERQVATLLTQVVVDQDDPAFARQAAISSPVFGRPMSNPRLAV